MTTEAKATRAAYFREYRRKNRDKVKTWNENYWQKKADKAAAAALEDEAKEGEKV